MTDFATTPAPAVRSSRRLNGRPSHRLLLGTLRDVQQQLQQVEQLRSWRRVDEAATVQSHVQERLGELIEHLDRPAEALPVAEQRTTWAHIMTVAAAVLAIIAVLFGISALSAPKASAAVLAASTPSIVVDAQRESFTLNAWSTGNEDGYHGASLWIGYPNSSTMMLAGTGESTTSTVPIQARLRTDLLEHFGQVDAVVVDDVTGDSTPVVLDIRRKTRSMLNHVEARDGLVALGARITHYSPAAGGYVSSQLSPVRFQELTAAGWVTRGTATTTRDGLAGVIIPAGSGTHLYRVVRTAGETVTAGVSTARRILVPGGC